MIKRKTRGVEIREVKKAHEVERSGEGRKKLKTRTRKVLYEDMEIKK